MKLRLAAVAIAAVGLLCAAGVVRAAESWTPFFMIKEGVVYVDRNSVEHDQGYVRLATELWFESPPDLRGMLLNYVRSRLRLSCLDRTFVIVDQRYFGMDGQLLMANLNPSEAKVPKPGAFESALITTYCGTKPAPGAR